MEALLGTVLALLIIATLLYPFFSSRRGAKRHALTHPPIQDEPILRRSIYREMVNLQSDFEAGYMSPAEHSKQLAEMKVAAAESMRRENAAKRQMIEAELRIEREVQRARSIALKDECSQE